MISKCKNCNKNFEHDVSGNMILFCTYCRKCAGSVSDYGFGPIRRTLLGKYADLEVS